MLTVTTSSQTRSDIIPGLNETVSGLLGLASTIRLLIITRLQQSEMCVNELATELNLSPSALSQHLTRLRAAGFVTVRREGQHRIYKANAHAIAYLITRLKLLVQE